MATDERDIQALVAQAQAGHRESLAELFERFHDRVYRFLRVRLSDEQVAEDLTQTVFVEMIQSLHRYTTQPNAKFSTWLFQIARFRLIDHYRSHRDHVSIDDPVTETHPALAVDPPTPAEPDIDEAFRKLPERYQTVIHLRFREDLSVRDVADIMHTSTLNVRVLQHRALRALRRLLSS